MIKTISTNAFDDFENPQIVWEIYGEILDFYDQHPFTARQLSYELNFNTKLINRVLHRLIQFKAIRCTGKDHWGVKKYQLNEAFQNL